MWRSLKNFLYSLWTYSDLSPDLRLRRRVNQALRQRANLSASDWHRAFWQSRNIPKPISDFVYSQMQAYSGLEFGRVQPSDRLHEDLYLSLVCWFDWELAFCEAFTETFGVELESQFNPDTLTTVEDLLVFLNHQLLSVNLS